LTNRKQPIEIASRHMVTANITLYSPVESKINPASIGPIKTGIVIPRLARPVMLPNCFRPNISKMTSGLRVLQLR